MRCTLMKSLSIDNYIPYPGAVRLKGSTMVLEDGQSYKRSVDGAFHSGRVTNKAHRRKLQLILLPF